MSWPTTLPRTRALGIAALWPAMLLVAYVALTRLVPIWIVGRGDGEVIHAEVVAEPGAWATLAVLLLIPPLGFLIAWAIARR
jgi:hypothetical protein